MSQGAGTRPLRPSCILTKSTVHANSYILQLKQLNLFISQKHLNKQQKKTNSAQSLKCSNDCVAQRLKCINDCVAEQVRHYYSKLAVKAQRT